MNDAVIALEPSSLDPPAPRPPATVEAALLALAGSELGELRERVVEIAVERTGADVVVLLDVGAADLHITVVAQHGLPVTGDLTATAADVALLLGNTEARLSSTPGGGGGAITELLRSNGLRTGMVAGLGRHGVDQLLVAGRARGRFGTSAGPILNELAAVLARADAQHRLSELAETRLRRQAAVAALGQSALGGDDVTALAQAASEAIAANLPAAIVGVLERSGDGFAVRAGIGLTDEIAVGRELRSDQTFSETVMRTGEPLLVADIAGDAMSRKAILTRLLGSGSLLVVPIQSGRRPIGTVTVVSRTRNAYGADDVTFVQALANVVALAAERARVQAQLRLSVEELRKSAEDRQHLLAHVVQAQEEERRRIADDIHDNSVQVMTAVALRLATLRRRLGEDRLDPLMTNLEHDVRQSITRLRHLMFVLRPPALENQGIAAALQAFLALVTEEAGLSYSLEDRLRIEPETEARIVVYRIAQEAVANVCKHARATRIEVILDEADGGVLVTIRDNGVGFDANRPAPTAPGHLGLAVMRERAEQSGGWCVVESLTDHGTTVRYCVGSRALRTPEPPSEYPMAVMR